jgi:AcrR family transcriptional regulator
MSHPVDQFLADSRQRLILAATEIFMEEGYRASVDRIAMRAGVAKQTLYNHFPSKDDLFTEVVRVAAASILVTLDDGSRDLRDSLLGFGSAFCAKVLGHEGLAHYRVMIAESSRFPELAQAFFTKGPAQTVAGLAAFIAAAMARGELREDDPRLAAEVLLSMLSGFERTRRLLAQPTEVPDPQHEQARIAKIVDCFLRAYAAERTAS